MANVVPTVSAVAMFMAAARVFFFKWRKKASLLRNAYRQLSSPAPYNTGLVGRCTAGSKAGSIRRRSSSAR